MSSNKKKNNKKLDDFLKSEKEKKANKDNTIVFAKSFIVINIKKPEFQNIFFYTTKESNLTGFEVIKYANKKIVKKLQISFLSNKYDNKGKRKLISQDDKRSAKILKEKVLEFKKMANRTPIFGIQKEMDYKELINHLEEVTEIKIKNDYVNLVPYFSLVSEKWAAGKLKKTFKGKDLYEFIKSRKLPIKYNVEEILEFYLDFKKDLKEYMNDVGKVKSHKDLLSGNHLKIMSDDNISNPKLNFANNKNFFLIYDEDNETKNEFVQNLIIKGKGKIVRNVKKADYVIVLLNDQLRYKDFLRSRKRNSNPLFSDVYDMMFDVEFNMRYKDVIKAMKMSKVGVNIEILFYLDFVDLLKPDWYKKILN